MSRDVVDLFLF